MPVVPPVAVMLSKLPLVDEYDLSSVRAILVAGAPIGREVFQRLKIKFGWMVTQAYGMTETTLTILFTHPRVFRKNWNKDIEEKMDSVGVVMPFQETKVCCLFYK